MVIRTAPQGPVVLALSFLDRQVINAGQTTAHETILGELPVFIAIGPVSATAWKCIKTGKMKMWHFSGTKFAAGLA